MSGRAGDDRAQLAHLAEEGADAAAEVVRGASLDRLGAAVEALDVALARPAPGRLDPRTVAAIRDGTGDLLAALCAAGVDPRERAELAGGMAALLGAAARDLRGDDPAPP